MRFYIRFRPLNQDAPINYNFILITPEPSNTYSLVPVITTTTATTPTVVLTPTIVKSTPKLKDIPNLYSKVIWETPTRQITFVRDLKGNDEEIYLQQRLSTPINYTPTNDFIAYYETELTRRGWEQTLLAFMFDEYQVWAKNNQYFVFGYYMESHNPDSYILFVRYNQNTQ